MTQKDLIGAFERNGNQLLAANAHLDQSPDLLFARRIEMADRIKTDYALRAKATVEQISDNLAR